MQVVVSRTPPVTSAISSVAYSEPQNQRFGGRRMPGALITLPLSALIALVGIRALVVTVRHWTGRQPGRPISTWMRSARSLDTEARRAYDRGGLAFGVALLFFAIMIAEVGIF